MTRYYDVPPLHPLRNPYHASTHILGQCMTHRGKNMVCLAFSENDLDAMCATIRESNHDYRMTFADGPYRSYEQRKGKTVTTQDGEDGPWIPRTERMIG